jgi:hypothetical protein
MTKIIKSIIFSKIIVLLLFLISINSAKADFKTVEVINSPDKNIVVSVLLSEDGFIAYNVKHKKQVVIDTSTLGFEFKNMPPIADNLKIANVKKDSYDETWELPWGEERLVRNNYNQLILYLSEDSQLKRKLNLIFRVYNDGLGFRYYFPEQSNLNEIFITEEKTQFKLTGDHDVWWMPGDWDIYEHLYNHTKFSYIDALSKRNNPDLNSSYIPENAVNTPVTMKTTDGVYLSFHEAALEDYADMTLMINKENMSMESILVGSDNRDYKVVRKLPFATPWRSIQIGDKAGDLIESKLILNLNEPNKLGDVSWIKPMKYAGIWWEMHLGVSTWDYAGSQDMNTFMSTNPEPTGKHGATTENAKKYIDFASKNNIQGVLVEGWNIGWEYWRNEKDREHAFDFITPYPDYDLEEVVNYGKERGVELIMHHETSSAVPNYEKHQDKAFGLMKSLGLHNVKTGYVGKIIPRGEYHHGQYMVNHYINTAKKAAQYKVALDVHEPVKPTGLRRTYPNLMSAEGVRGQEFNAWATDGGNPPNHNPTIVFTRMLAGPIDFTPGIFDIKLTKKKDNKYNNRVHTTLAQQLALYVVIYSPLQMVADLVENYDNHPALQFIRDVPVDWETTKVLNGEIGEYVTIARKERNGNDWFIGSITNEKVRTFDIALSFLDDGANYIATIYEDGKDADWEKNPTSYNIRKLQVNNKSTIRLKLASGGGAAISVIKN